FCVSMISATSMSRGADAGAGSSAAAGIAFTVPLTLVSDQTLEHGRPAHIAAITRVVECRGAVHGAAIVPDYEVAGLPPGHPATELWLRRELDEVADQRTPLLEGQAKYVRSMRCDVQRFASRARMNLDQLVMRRGLRDPFRFGRLRIAREHSRMPEP